MREPHCDTWYESDQYQGRYLSLWNLCGQIDRNPDLIGIAQFHQRYVVTDEVELACNRHQFLIALIEHVAHHLRQLQYRVLGLLRVYVYECVDVVQRVHEEVRINLVAQILQLLFQILLLQPQQLFLVATRTEIELDAEVHAEHQYKDYDGYDVVFADEYGWAPIRSLAVEIGWGLVAEPSVHGLEISLLHRVRLWTTEMLWAAIALIDGKTTYHAERQQPVEPTLAAIDEQGSQQEVVDEE